MSNIEIQSKVNDLRELRRMAEELDTEITAIQDAIKQHMSAAGLDELTGADFKVTWKEVASTRIDTGALKKAMPDIAAAFTRSTTTRRFCVA